MIVNPHVIAVTNNPLINELKNEKRFIKENAKKKEIYIDSINGHTEHLHCLFSLNGDMSIAKAMQLIKGESSESLLVLNFALLNPTYYFYFVILLSLVALATGVTIAVALCECSKFKRVGIID